MAKVKRIEQEVKPSLNPEKKYGWKEDDIFEISGKELDILKQVIIDPVSQIATKYEAYLLILDILKKGIEQGVIFEISDEVVTLAKQIDDKLEDIG